jgi:hypothetical protein
MNQPNLIQSFKSINYEKDLFFRYRTDGNGHRGRRGVLQKGQHSSRAFSASSVFLLLSWLFFHIRAIFATQNPPLLKSNHHEKAYLYFRHPDDNNAGESPAARLPVRASLPLPTQPYAVLGGSSKRCPFGDCP